MALQADAAPPPEEVGASLFFARCPPSLPYDELLQLFSAFGEVEKLNLYRRWAKARNSKGCGTVVFASKASAAAAKSALDGKHTFPDAESNMVVEWAEPSKLSRSDDSQTGERHAGRQHCTPLCIHMLTAQPAVRMRAMHASADMCSGFVRV